MAEKPRNVSSCYHESTRQFVGYTDDLPRAPTRYELTRDESKRKAKKFPQGRHRTPDPPLTNPATYHCSAAASAESAFCSALIPRFRSATEKFRVRREKVAIMQKMTPWIVFRAYQDPIPQVSAREAITA